MSAATRRTAWREIAAALIEANGGGHYEIREFPEERKRIDIGDFVTDDRQFRALTGWDAAHRARRRACPLARLLPPPPCRFISES